METSKGSKKPAEGGTPTQFGRGKKNIRTRAGTVAQNEKVREVRVNSRGLEPAGEEQGVLDCPKKRRYPVIKKRARSQAD